MDKRLFLIPLILLSFSACSNRSISADAAQNADFPPASSGNQNETEWSIHSEEGKGDEPDQVIASIVGTFELIDYYPTVEWERGMQFNMPEEDIEKLLNQTISISMEDFIGYDNFRFPEQYFYRESFVERYTINSPEYHVEMIPQDQLGAAEPTRKDAIEHYCGEREEYIRVSVYPGFTNPEADPQYVNVPQFFMIDEDSFLLIANGVTFIASRVEE